MPSMVIDSIRCQPGEKASGYVGALERVDGTAVGIPVVIVAGKHDGPVLLVDGGIHGDEQEGTLAIARFARELDPSELRGVFIGVPVMNVGAFEAMSRGNPRDTHSHDMNRIYPGRASGFLTERVAHVHHSRIAAQADLEITIHSGGNICYLAETIFTGAGDEKSAELARAMGPDWPILLETPHPVNTPMAAMANLGKPAITVELGGAARTMPDALGDNVEVLENALRNVCRHYEMLPGEPRYAAGHWRGKQQVVQASRSGMLDPLPHPPLKKPMRKDEVLLRITDLFGSPIEELRAPCDGTLFGLRTYPSVTAGDWCLFCAEARFESSAPGD
jgi:predicted deacylase